MVKWAALQGLDALFVLLTSVYLLYTLTVDPANFNWALIYSVMVVFYFLALIMSKLSPFNQFIKTDTYSEKSDDIVPWKLVVWIGLGIFIFMILRAGTLGYSVVDAPVFSPSPGTGPEFQPIRSGIAGVMENRFFFCFLFFTLLATFSIFLRKEVAIPGAILANTIIFTIYHWFVYGSQQVALMTVAAFGLISTVLMFFVRIPFILDAIHAGSNIGVTWARISDVSIFIYFQTLLPWIVGAVLVYLFWERFK